MEKEIYRVFIRIESITTGRSPIVDESIGPEFDTLEEAIVFKEIIMDGFLE